MITEEQAPEAVAEEIVAPVEGETAVEQVVEPVTEVVVDPVLEEPAVEVTAETDPIEAPEAVAEVEEDPEPENVFKGLIDGDAPVRMINPDGGGSDAYPTEGDHLIVPAADVPTMNSHGFVVVAEGDE